MDDTLQLNLLDKLKDTKTNEEFFNLMKAKTQSTKIDNFRKCSNIAGRYCIATLCNDDFSFEYSQYLNLVSLSGKEIPLSIASSPLDLPKLKVIYRPEFSNPDSLLLEEMLDQQTVDALHH